MGTLELFKIGYGQAGVISLAVVSDFHSAPNRPNYGTRITRLNIELEDATDLRTDVQQALERKVKPFFQSHWGTNV